VNGPEEGAKTLKKLASGEYAVIYITEALQAEIEPEIEKYKTEKLPAIIAIPGVSGNTGKGIMNVKKLVEQAVGSDIIFNNEN
jgi:V/A-type H+-transporting ATPase subunit F